MSPRVNMFLDRGNNIKMPRIQLTNISINDYIPFNYLRTCSCKTLPSLWFMGVKNKNLLNSKQKIVL